LTITAAPYRYRSDVGLRRARSQTLCTRKLAWAALRAGSLIIAAAGNESGRDFGFIAPVGAPANSPSIMAVAAVDPNLKVAPFSCGGINPDGGEVNIAGPGVSMFLLPAAAIVQGPPGNQHGLSARRGDSGTGSGIGLFPSRRKAVEGIGAVGTRSG
jgi:Subtilase family